MMTVFEQTRNNIMDGLPVDPSVILRYVFGDPSVWFASAER
jgi:hypothetical protein